MCFRGGGLNSQQGGGGELDTWSEHFILENISLIREYYMSVTSKQIVFTAVLILSAKNFTYFWYYCPKDQNSRLEQAKIV